MIALSTRSRGLMAAMTIAVSVMAVSAAVAQTPTPYEVPKIARPLPAPADVAAPPADAVKTASGLITKVIQPGTGTTRPTMDNQVTIHYTGWTSTGSMIGSSFAVGHASRFVVGQLIPGWAETVSLMVVGEKRRAWIPEELTYKGAAGRPKGTLVFDVELLGVKELPKAPADVAAAPADATTTASGLVYKVLQPGTGLVHPAAAGTVVANYTGWTTDGKLFDSTAIREEPSTFGLDKVIPGWTEGLQLMVEGAKYRFWVPEKLAYQGQAGKPAGTLVFEIELVKVQ